MNIFENLIEELKEENLLESSSVNENENSEVDKSESKTTEVTGKNLNPESNYADIQISEQVDESSETDSILSAEASSEDVDADSEAELENNKIEDQSPEIGNSEVEKEEKEFDETEFFRQRAIDEVSGLQMVEHVISGIEREQLKSSSTPYDDVKVKQALHNFLKIEDSKSPAHAQAEFQLMQETEDWYSSLSRRDRNILAAQFRRFCEQTKPGLSSRALMSLARFYRNSPFSESVRSKFDLIVTRLFTKELNDNSREMLFDKDEIIIHLKELYADWSSIPLYSIQDDDSELLLNVLQFQDFVDEIKHIETFDEMIRTDLFNRVKFFKEKTSENFFSPLLVSAAVECNVEIGNKYVELIEKEKNSNNFSEKYDVLNDEAISEVSSKTLELLAILKEKSPPVEQEKSPQPETITELELSKSEKPELENLKNSNSSEPVERSLKTQLFGLNKWLLLGMTLVLIFSVIILFTQFSSGVSDNKGEIASGGKIVNLEQSFLSQHINNAKIHQGTFFAVAKPTWMILEKSEKEIYLRKIQSLGKEYEFEKIMLMDEKGAVIASSNGDNLKVSEKNLNE